ncbi:MAG: diaminopimelate decarboxylase [Porphyromonadaceae bacterium]|nr:diaminopimelate decarboxylase [Porphyromonadaceae bacterium]
MKANYPINKFKDIDTPFYYYDLEVLRETLSEINNQIQDMPFLVHYALKANVNPKLLKVIKDAGLGADCVSGGEIQAAIDAGIEPEKIAFAGVGKADWEINLALDHDIFCFNVESIPELEVINELAGSKNKTAAVALRINPDIDAHTHHKITTGLNENKFGINMEDMGKVVSLLPTLSNINVIGVHFHVGSQITDMTVFQDLCVRLREIQKFFTDSNIQLKHFNVGGGLGVNYEHPNHFPIPDFEAYFKIFKAHVILLPGQTLHFELGRSIVAQCGALISKVLYVKEGVQKNFVILDAGFTELIRPAMYGAYHRIENLTSELPEEEYDVVGPICESSDVFAKDYYINKPRRGDIMAIRTAGAYGEIMASQYNLRELPKSYTSDELSPVDA